MKKAKTNREFPEEITALIKEYSMPLTRPDWRLGCMLRRTPCWEWLCITMLTNTWLVHLRESMVILSFMENAIHQTGVHSLAHVTTITHVALARDTMSTYFDFTGNPAYKTCMDAIDSQWMELEAAVKGCEQTMQSIRYRMNRLDVHVGTWEVHTDF